MMEDDHWLRHQEAQRLFCRHSHLQIKHVKNTTFSASYLSYLLLVFRRKDHEHGDDVVEKVAEAKDEIVVEDVVAVGELVPVALLRHRDPRHAGEEGKRTARQLVTNIQDSIRLDLKSLAELFPRHTVLQKVGDSTKDEREEDDSEDKLNCSCEKTRLVGGRVERHLESVESTFRLTSNLSKEKQQIGQCSGIGCAAAFSSTLRNIEIVAAALSLSLSSLLRQHFHTFTASKQRNRITVRRQQASC